MYYVCTNSSCIISFENVPMDVSGTTSGNVNAQVELYNNGDVELRYGSGTMGTNNNFVSGVHSTSEQVAMPSPLTECSGLTGICDTFPSNEGVRFSCKILIASHLIYRECHCSNQLPRSRR